MQLNKPVSRSSCEPRPDPGLDGLSPERPGHVGIVAKHFAGRSHEERISEFVRRSGLAHDRNRKRARVECLGRARRDPNHASQAFLNQSERAIVAGNRLTGGNRVRHYFSRIADNLSNHIRLREDARGNRAIRCRQFQRVDSTIVPSAGVESLHKPPLTEVFAAASAATTESVRLPMPARPRTIRRSAAATVGAFPMRFRLATVVSGDRV